MCGRYSLSTTKEKIQEEFGILPPDQLILSYNIAPTHLAQVIINEDPVNLDHLYWGLIPYWSKEANLNGRLINARIEGISTKPSFRMAIRKRRCLVLADSFYEWKKEGGKKIPYRIFPKDGSLLALAGIWEIWENENQKKIRTFSILTTNSNEDVEMIHNRMPLFFTKDEDKRKWLSNLNLEQVQEMLRIPKPGFLSMYRVTEKVNSPSNNFAEMHQEIPEPPSLF